MKKSFIFILGLSIFAIFGCASGGKVMSQEAFSQVSVGMTYQEVTHQLGRPYSMKNLGNGEIEYKYIEKIIVGRSNVIQERHYLILFKNGRVTSTKINYLNRPSYEGNSYEMQTSYNKENDKK